MQVMLTVYRLNKSQQHATRFAIINQLDGKLDEQTIRSKIEKLLDLGLLEQGYTNTSTDGGNNWVSVVSVSTEALPTVKRLEDATIVRDRSIGWHQIQFHTIPPESVSWELRFMDKDGYIKHHPHTGDMSMVQDIDIDYQPKCHGSVPYCNDPLMPVPNAVCFESCQKCPFRKNISQ